MANEQTPKLVHVINEKGEIFQGPEANLSKLPQGFRMATPEEVQENQFRAEQRGSLGAEAAARSFINTAGFGVPGLVEDKLNKEYGIGRSGKEQAIIAEESPIANAAGMVGGVLVDPFSTVGLVGKAGIAAEKAILKAAAKEGTESLAKKIIAEKVLPTAAKGAVEGAAFGAGDAITESVFQDKPLTAESVAAGIGMGALIGAPAEVAMKLGANVIKTGTSATMDKIQDLLKKAPDLAEKESIDATGRTLGATVKWHQNTPDAMKRDIRDMVQEVAFSKTDDAGKVIGENGLISATRKASNIDALEKGISQIKKDTVEAIQGLYKSVDEKMGSVPFATKAEYNSILNNIKNIVLETGDSTHIKKLNDAINFVEKNVIKGKEDLTISDLWKARQAFDKKYYGMSNLSKQIDNPYAQGLYQARTDFNNLIFNKLDNLQTTNPSLFEGNVVQDIKQNNRRFATAQQSLDLIDKQAAKEAAKRPLSVVDTIIGASSLIEPASLVILAAKKIGQKYQDPLLSMVGSQEFKGLNSIYKYQESVAKEINKLTSAFTKERPVATPIVTKSILDYNFGEDKTPEDKNKQVDKIRSDLQAYAQNPSATVDKLATLTSGISATAPEISHNLQMNVTKAVAYLSSKVPRDPFTGSLYRINYTYPDSQIASFTRTLNAVNDPLSVLRDLNRGVVTPEGVDALRNVYPNLYSQVIKQFTEKLAAPPAQSKMTYQNRLQLSQVLGIPVDNLTNPQFLYNIQKQYSPVGNNPEQVNKQLNTSREIDAAKNTMTDTQRVSNK